MKKTIILLGATLMLSACAAGINHNTTTVNNKAYLIETRTRNFFGLFQWSENPKYISVEQDISNQGVAEKCIAEIKINNPKISDNEYAKQKIECKKKENLIRKF